VLEEERPGLFGIVAIFLPKKKLSACRGEGSVVGPLLAAYALSLCCAASTMLTIYTGYA
jgi:hypothetical protein